jgi:hypothetical protein
MSVNGQSDVLNTFLIDGVDNNGPTLASAVRPSVEGNRGSEDSDQPSTPPTSGEPAEAS